MRRFKKWWRENVFLKNSLFNIKQILLLNFNKTAVLPSFIITFALLGGYHLLQSKPAQLGMVNLHDINQSFIYFLAQQELTDEQKNLWLERFSDALNQEMERLSKDTVLFSAQQVVTPLPDYTPIVKEAISQHMKEK